MFGEYDFWVGSAKTQSILIDNIPGAKTTSIVFLPATLFRRARAKRWRRLIDFIATT